jgi:hypothetical protein
MFAARKADIELLKYMVKQGADPAALDNQGKSAVDYVELPEEPPENWENAHEAWGYECADLLSVIAYLRSLLEKK